MSLFASVVNFTAKTSTGTQDIAGSLGGLQPKIAMFFMSEETTLSVTPIAPAHICVGFTDGTNEFYASSRNNDNLSTGVTFSAAFTDAVIRGITSGGAQDFLAVFDAFIPNGVRINWTDASPIAFQGYVVLLAGTDIKNAFVGTAGTNNDITDPGFAVNHVIMAAIGTGIANANITSNYQLMFGMGLDDTIFTNSPKDNMGWGSKEIDALSSSATNSVFEEAAVIKRINDTAASGGFFYTLTVDTYDANGFTTNSGDTNSEKVGYLAIEWAAGCDVRLETILNTDFTTTGVHKHDYGVDFGGTGTPVLNMLSGCGSRVASGTRDNNDSGGLYIGALDGTNEFTIGNGVDDGASTTDTTSFADSKGLTIPNIFNPNSVTLVRAVFDSFASDGVNMNYNPVFGGSAFRSIGLVVVPSGLEPPIFMDNYLRQMGA